MSGVSRTAVRVNLDRHLPRVWQRGATSIDFLPISGRCGPSCVRPADHPTGPRSRGRFRWDRTPSRAPPWQIPFPAKTFFPKPSSSGLATTRWMSSRRRVSLPTAGINRSSPFLKFSRLRKRIIRLWPTSGNNRQIHLVVAGPRGRRLWKERLVCGGLAEFDLPATPG